MKTKAKILCVDDDPEIQDVIKTYLEEEGHTVFIANDESSAMSTLTKNPIDIVLLDLILGEDDGMSVLKNIRLRTEIPVIMISGRGDGTDRIIGIEAGADDYIAKPFLPRELSARIHAVLRRTAQPTTTVKAELNQNDSVKFGSWILDKEQYQVFDEGGQSANLTTGEFMVLNELISKRNKAISREKLFELLRDPNSNSMDRAVDIQILRIRQKLEDNPRTPKYIKTIRNVGYMFIAPVETE